MMTLLQRSLLDFLNSYCQIFFLSYLYNTGFFFNFHKEKNVNSDLPCQGCRNGELWDDLFQVTKELETSSNVIKTHSSRRQRTHFFRLLSKLCQ